MLTSGLLGISLLVHLQPDYCFLFSVTSYINVVAHKLLIMKNRSQNLLSRNRSIVVVCGILFISTILFSAFYALKWQNVRTQNNANSQYPAHANNFYNDELFRSGVQKSSSMKLLPYRMAAGIIPHHILAAPVLSDFFSTLAQQKPKRIILIGPDHYEAGISHVFTSKFDWNTPYGRVRPDISIVEQLIRNGIQVDESASEYEHSIGALTPYISYYVPDASIIPIIVSGRMEYEEILKISASILKFIDAETVVLASVDFSHNLHSDEADKRDAKTEQYIREFALKNIYALNSEYIDSPASLIMVLSIAERLQAYTVEILEHANSGEIQNNRLSPTTSYFSIALHE